MSTLIAVYNSDGCVGRCDAKCYGAAAGTPCVCICGGANHAAGQVQAADNTRVMAQAWLDRYREERGLTKEQVTGLINLELAQHSLDLGA